MATPLAVTVHVELAPAQLVEIRAAVRRDLVDLVTRMAAEELDELVRATVYRVIREDVTEAAEHETSQAAEGVAP